MGPKRKMMMARVDRMMIGDRPAFAAALKMAAKAFAGLKDAAVKHMIIISDGDPTPSTGATIRRLKQQGVKVSTVAVGSHGRLGSQEMQKIASATGGKYYAVKSANALPRIYQREARRIARPLVYEPKPPVQPAIVSQHEILQGMEGGVPPISGFVLTSVKENPLVEVLLRSPKLGNEKNSTVLATWTYGAGKAVALTTDAGQRWANQWAQWEGYDKLFSQMVRWSMRPTDDLGNFSIAMNVSEGKTQVIITALDEDDQFLNDLSISGTVVGPDMSSLPLRIEQTAPGRYVGEFDSEVAGSYMIVANTGADRAPIRSGVNVGYSAEYRVNETNLALLRSLSELKAKGGQPGMLVEAGLDTSQPEAVEAANPFRRDMAPAISNQSIWPWLILAGNCLFFADVFIRRVQVNFLWLVPMLARMRDTVLRRERAVPVPETMSRLQSRKREISKQIERRRATARFEESAELTEESQPLAPSVPTAKPSQQKVEQPEEQPDEESYTERLLKAKRRVWDERDKDSGRS